MSTETNAPEPTETVTFPLEQLTVGRARVIKQGGHQIAVFRQPDDQVYALDNRCPHEGYPLAQGYVKDCLLTCAWHNFKFDLRDGHCVKGDEDVRVYPARVVQGQVELDLKDPSLEILQPKLMASLEEALLQGRMGQAARDAVRLLNAGLEPEMLLLFAARFDADHAEYGSTHTLPLAADCLRYLPRYRGVDAVRPIMQAFDMASEPNLRRAKRVQPGAVDPGEDPIAAGSRLQKLVEEECAEEAEALLLGALEKGWGREVIAPWFYRLCTDHFLDFGHALIYVIKGMALLDRVGWREAPALLPSLLFRIINGTREDTLPAFAPLRRRMEALEPELPDLLARQALAPKWDPGTLLQVVLEGPIVEVFEVLTETLRAGVPTRRIIDTLSVAASERMLRFDVGIDLDPGVQEAWLWVTHALTFTNAVRHALTEYRTPDSLKLLYYAARFINNNKPLDMEPLKRFDVAPEEGAIIGVERILQDIRGKCARLAVTGAATWLARDEPIALLWEVLEDLSLSDPMTRPIFVTHVIKTLFALREEYEALEGHPQQALPVLALVRFLASPIQERRVAQIALEAINFVSHGRTPRTLTG